MTELKRKLLDQKNKKQQELNHAKRKPKTETWEAKMYRIKTTAEKVNKAIGLPL